MTPPVAITGAGGFVGRRIVDQLLDSGSQVYAVTSHPETLPRRPGLSCIVGPWGSGDLDRTVRECREAQTWIHAAARVDLRSEDPAALLRDNAEFTGRLVDSVARMNPEARMVYLSSVSVYGRQQEWRRSVVPAPDTPYGLSKLRGEQAVLDRLQARATVLRLAGVWGTEARPKLFINRCLARARAGEPLTLDGSVSARRNYVWVGDVAEIAGTCIEDSWSGIRLVGSGDPLSIREMVMEIAAVCRVGVTNAPDQTPAPEQRDQVVEVSEGVTSTPFRTALNREVARYAPGNPL